MDERTYWRFVMLSACATLGGCSYGYDLAVRVIDGRIAFLVAPDSAREPECLREIAVTADDGRYMWDVSVGHDDACENTFPINYGAKLMGKPWVYGDYASLPEDVRGKPAPQVVAKPLEIGVIYTVNATIGATGYGCGRFRIKADRTVENLGCNFNGAG